MGEFTKNNVIKQLWLCGWLCGTDYCFCTCEGQFEDSWQKIDYKYREQTEAEPRSAGSETQLVCEHLK